MPADNDTAAITDDQTSEIETYLTDIAQGVSQLLPESAQSSWQIILQHPILGALLIALASYIIAVSFRSLLANLVGRITGLTRPSVDDAVMKDLRKPIFKTIFFLGLSLAVVVANLPAGGITLIKIFLSIITASWMGAVKSRNRAQRSMPTTRAQSQVTWFWRIELGLQFNVLDNQTGRSRPDCT